MTALKVEKFERDSNFELCRIACIIYIVFYHLFIHVNNNLDNMWYTKPLTSIFHIGVVVFVMISGYWGIKRRLYKLLYILSLIVFYNLIGFLVAHFIFGKQLVLSDFLCVFLPFSHGKYWFMTSYLVLFMIAPYINKILDSFTKKEFAIYLLVLGFIVFYLGGVCQSSLGGGRGIAAFVLSYSIGRYIRIYYPHRLSSKLFYCAFFPYILVCVLFFVFYEILPIRLAKVLNHFFFGYNSIGLYLMSILFFLGFKQMSFKSHLVNYLATPVLAVYLIHGNSFISDALIYKPFEEFSLILGNNSYLLLICQSLFTILIVLSCIYIDIIREKLFDLFKIDLFLLSMERECKDRIISKICKHLL